MRHILLATALVFTLLAPSLTAQQEGEVGDLTASPRDTLRVATKDAPPFSMKGGDGTWQGISIDLWGQVADEMGVPYTLVEDDLKGMLDGVRDGTYDVGIAAISITAEREESLDFSQAYYQSGLGIAVSSSGGSDWIRVASRLISVKFLSVVAALMVLLALVGVLIWLVERRKNPEQFGGSPWHGIGSGFWWSAVTMTTVGYGDKAPVTAVGRLIGLIWMFAGIIIISSFTAAIAASLTVSELGSDVGGPDDLPGVRVGSVEGATAGDWLGERSIGHRGYADMAAGLEAVADGEIDAFVHDAPMLKHAVKNGYDGELGVLPETFDKQFYGIALRENSTLREEVNRALLLHASGPGWNRLLSTYLGD